jgi:acyl carrier protein phosphodiesterase
LTFLWSFTGAALILAAVALMKARRLARRLDRLTESYWELRYEYGQLRARLNRLDPEPSAAAPSEPSPQSGVIAFVPLSSLKR